MSQARRQHRRPRRPGRRGRRRRDPAHFPAARRSTAAQTIDLDVVTRQSKENPVFYVQYAHARIASIGRVAAERGVDAAAARRRRPRAARPRARARACCARCPSCPTWCRWRATDRAPHKVTTWVRELADRFHGFYHDCYVMGDGVSPELTQARLWLVEAAGSGSPSASTCSACQRPGVDVSASSRRSRRPAARHGRGRRRRAPARSAACDLARRWPSEFGTPLFVYDEAHLRARCREAVAAFGDGVAYATKAFLCRAMARLVARGGHAPRRRHRRRAATSRSAAGVPRRPARAARQQQVASTSCARPSAAGVGRIVVDSLRRARPPRARCTPPTALVPEGAGAGHARGRGPHPRVRARPARTTRSSASASPSATPRRAVEPGRGVAGGRPGRAPRPHRQPGLRRRLLRAGRRGAGPVRRASSACPSCRSAAASAWPTSRARRRPTITEWGDGRARGVPRRRHHARRSPPSRAGPSSPPAGGHALHASARSRSCPASAPTSSVDGGMSDNPRPGALRQRLRGVPARGPSTADRPRRRHASSASTASRATCSCATPRCPPTSPSATCCATPVTGAYGHSMGSNYNKVPRPAVVFVRDGERPGRRPPRDLRRPAALRRLTVWDYSTRAFRGAFDDHVAVLVHRLDGEDRPSPSFTAVTVAVAVSVSPGQTCLTKRTP